MLFRGIDLSGFGGFTYITTNRPDGVLYVGFTDDLYRRIAEHKAKHYPNAFSAQYNLDKLVYFELFETAAEAYARIASLKITPQDIDNRLLRLTAAVAAEEAPAEKLRKFTRRRSYKECAPLLQKLAEEILLAAAQNR